MKIDCRNLACPQPVVLTKNAFESLKIGDELEILVNELAPFENVKRFLGSLGQNFEIKNLENGENLITLVKNSETKNDDVSSFTCEIKKKVIYLNEDRAGSGEVGEVLLSKFLGAFLQTKDLPYAVLCVNKAVNLTTNRGNASFVVLRELESRGVKILSCGSCLEAYKLVDKLGVGSMTNAYEIAEILSEFDEIKL